eukprot:jgi/Hompol1/7082/HPOL_002435-RA
MLHLPVSPGKCVGKLALGLPLPGIVAYLRRESGSFGNFDLKFSDKQHAIPTIQGVYNPDSNSYTLSYPGISFEFPIPPSFSPLKNASDLPIQFPDGTTPVLRKMHIFSGKLLSDATLYKIQNMELYHDRVLVKVPRHGIKFCNHNCDLSIGATCQDVLFALGRPEGTMIKPLRDKMGIYQSDETQLISQYIWNYFSMGIDIIFDGINHRVVKFVLHNNILDHPDANLPFGSTSFFALSGMIFEV